MKKLLFILFTFTTLLSSCSSDDDNFDQTDPNITTKTYPVNLNIKSTAFNIDKAPLTKSTGFGDIEFLQVIAYKESGEVFSDSVIYAESLKTLLKADSTIAFTLNLPEGNYNLSVFSLGKRYGIQNHAISIEYPIGPISPKNYNTDEYRLPVTSINNYPQNNTGLYYFTNSLTVSAEGNNSLDNIILEPMWSDITITLKDLNSAKLPSGTKDISVTFRPGYLNGFNIKTKLALDKNDSGFFADGAVDTFYRNFQLVSSGINISPRETLNYVSSKGENTDMSILIEYVTTDYMLQNWVVMGSQEFTFSNKFENGKSYNITGNLNVSTGDSNLNLKVSELDPNEIEIPFE